MERILGESTIGNHPGNLGFMRVGGLFRDDAFDHLIRTPVVV